MSNITISNVHRYKDPATGERNVDFTLAFAQEDRQHEPLAYSAFVNVNATPDSEGPAIITVRSIGWSDGMRTMGYDEGWDKGWDDSAEGQMLGEGWSGPEELKRALCGQAAIIADRMFYDQPQYTELSDDVGVVASHLRDVTDHAREADDYTFPAEIVSVATRLMQAIQAIEQCDKRGAARALNNECERYGRMQTSESERGWKLGLGDWSYHAFLKCAA